MITGNIEAKVDENALYLHNCALNALKAIEEKTNTPEKLFREKAELVRLSLGVAIYVTERELAQKRALRKLQFGRYRG